MNLTPEDKLRTLAADPKSMKAALKLKTLSHLDVMKLLRELDSEEKRNELLRLSPKCDEWDFQDFKEVLLTPSNPSTLIMASDVSKHGHALA